MTGPILDFLSSYQLPFWTLVVVLFRPFCCFSCTQAYEEQRVVVISGR